jgi:hypothetical protein
MPLLSAIPQTIFSLQKSKCAHSLHFKLSSMEASKLMTYFRLAVASVNELTWDEWAAKSRREATAASARAALQVTYHVALKPNSA